MTQTALQFKAEALALLAASQEGALGTLDEKGRPFVSAVGFVYEPEPADGWGSLYFFLSELARHTKHLAKNPAVNLLIVEQAPETPVHERKKLSLGGKIEKVQAPELKEILKAKYLGVFPRSKIFFTLSDFHFYCLKPEDLYWIGGFGKAAALS